ncbi:energy-coupling factor transporter ATP-binding protein EcfA2 [Cellulomonas soli]|nr:energy-coupling factor transporter ATP-binding protein EcfA2 [Cellulomonas soli]
MSAQADPQSAPSARPASSAHEALARDVLARPLAAQSLLDAVRDLHRDVAATTFPLDLSDTEAAAASRARLVDQLAEHLVPRLTELSAPAVVVVSGSTGAGKSTLVNSLVGREVSAAGVLRPTTRRPVLVHNPLDVELLSHHPVLESVEVVADESVPRGIALLDAPDLDSVLESNRLSAHRLLEAADLWLFVTTAARYGDALPWQVLQAAVDRGTSIAMVLNRVPPASLPTVRGDLLERLRGHGLQGSPLFVVPDVGPHEGLLASAVVAPIQRWLQMLAGPDRARTVIGRTLRGSLSALRPWVDELAEAVQHQADAAGRIADALDDALVEPTAQAVASVRGGAVADGAVRARWAELTTPGAAFAGIPRPSGRLRGSARAGRARAVAVEPLLADLARAVTSAMGAAGTHTERVLRARLVGPGAPEGGASVDAAWPSGDSVQVRTTAAEQTARAWVAQGPRAVRAALAVPPPTTTPEGDVRRGRDVTREARRRAKAEKILTTEGLAAIALAGAAGVVPARELLADVLGAAGSQAVEELSSELVDRVEAQVALERAQAGAALDDPDLADDAASRLRLRLAVLKGLT